MTPRRDLSMRAARGEAPRAPGRGLRGVRLLLGAIVASILTAALSPGAPHAQTVRNRADGTHNGVSLDTTRARVSLNRNLVPGAASTAEIDPIQVVAGSSNLFTLDLVPTVAVGDPVVDRVTVTLPPGHTNPVVQSFEVGGTALAAECPVPGPGRYCATVSGTTITVSLGAPVNVSATRLTLRFTADAPNQPARGDAAAAVVAAGGPRPAAPGDADGDPADGNTLTVTVRAEADSLRSTVTVDPPVVLADGTSSSLITVTLRDDRDRPVAGKTIVLSTDRGAQDALTQPAAPTDAAGVATGSIRSLVPGVTTITATNVTESVVIAARPQVTFTQGQAIQLAKAADRRDVVVGGLVGYAVTLRNRNARDLSLVRVEDRVPPDFKYVKGSATLDGVRVPDPTGDRVLVFDVGAVPAFVDGNGNGTPDPGEPGARVLRYQLVVGAGATPGEYRNLAVAKDACAACVISNADEASVRVRADEFFTLGTIVGKIFEDGDGDGRQGAGERGVAGGMVALDDGSYALTDRDGRYHFPAVQPGQRLAKIHLASLPGPARATTDEALWIRVTPGLIAKGNFGVVLERDTAEVGRPARPGLEIVALSERDSLEVVGTTQGPTVLVNGVPVPLPAGEARLSVRGLPEVVELAGDRLPRPITFRTALGSGPPVAAWSLAVLGARGDTAWLAAAEGAPPETLRWDGERRDGGWIAGGDVYQYHLQIEFADGSRVGSAVGTFGVNRAQAIALSLTGKAFEVGRDALSAGAREALRRVAETMRRFPKEKILIEGHTDDVGDAITNLELSRRRAAAARDHLTGIEGVAADRIVMRWYGEERPVASNAHESGRQINRRVEIKSQFQEVTEARVDDVFRTTPEVRIDGALIPVQAQGRFAARVADAGSDRLALELRDTRGHLVRQLVPLPALVVEQPAGTRRIAYGASEGGIDVRPRSPAAGGGGATRLISLEPTPDPVVATAALMGRTEPGNTVSLGRGTLATQADGTFRAELPLRLGANTFGLLVRNAGGVARIVNLLVTVADHDSSGALLIAARPVPGLTVYLPPRGVPLATPRLVVAGVTDPANRVTVNGTAVPPGPDGAFSTTLDLPRGTSRVAVEATDPDGNVALIERDLERVPPRLFLLALADGVVGRVAGRGHLEGAGRSGETGLWAGGRVAYYLKGTVAGKYLVTSALDARTREFGRTEPETDEPEEEVLLRSIDPDRLYPIYGDSSTVVHDAQTHGRFYLAVDSDELQATVGNFPLSLTDTELAAFQRTLYGGRASYRSLSRTRFGDPRTVVTVLGAEVRQQHVRDELQATGGSLYYLSHRDALEGSEQVSLAVRDRTTGLVLARLPQTRGVDYTVKYREGRLLFTRPIASVSEDGSLVSPGIQPGHPVTVEVDYETRVESLEQTSAGGRVQQRLGDHVAVGGTWLRDGSGGGAYQLQGADLELRLGSRSRITGELAGSRGVESRVYASADGGLSFSEVTPHGLREGRAVKLGADLDVGEWFGAPDRFAVRGYLKRVERDFFSSGNLSDRGLERRGLAARADLTRHDRLTLRHDREATTGADTLPGRSAEWTSLLWEHTRKRFGLGAEVQDRRSEGAGAGRAGYATGSVWLKPIDRLTGRLDHQATLAGPRNDQTRLGLQLQVLPALALEARGVTGTAGSSALGGAVLTVGEGSLYVSERLDQAAARRTVATVVGAQAPFGPGGRAYTEYQWERSPGAGRRLSVLGLQRRWDPGAAFSAFASGEHGDVEGPAGRSTRSALAGGVSWNRPSRLTASSRGEVRWERGATPRRQWVTAHHVEARFLGGLVALGTLRHGVTRDRAADRIEARFAERSLGLAYRPIDGDRVNALARVTRLVDHRGAEAAGDTVPAARAMDVVAAEATVDLTRRIAWSGKGALRRLEEGPDADHLARTHSVLVIQRIDYAVLAPVAVGVEYRVLGQREARDRRSGWLQEVSWKPARHLRVGTGYNFTDFTDDEFSRNDYSVRGWFLRVQGKY